MIGTNRHESRRVDLQLRGRAGRQGDPGESRFFVSLEDDLLVRYGIEALIAGRVVSGNRDEPLDHPVLRGEIARAQRIIEGQNVEIRKTLWRYASVIEGQRRHVMDARQAILHGDEMSEVWRRAPERRRALVEAVGEDAVRRAERAVTLFQIDRAWRDHLAFAADLREGIHLVSLGGQDPLTRFTTEIRLAFRAYGGRDRQRRARRSDRCARERRSDRSGWSRDQGTVIHLDVPRQRRSVPQPDRHDADRARENDRCHLCRCRGDAAAAPVGAGRSAPEKATEAPGESVQNVKTAALVLLAVPLSESARAIAVFCGDGDASRHEHGRLPREIAVTIMLSVVRLTAAIVQRFDTMTRRPTVAADPNCRQAADPLSPRNTVSSGILRRCHVYQSPPS